MVVVIKGTAKEIADLLKKIENRQDVRKVESEVSQSCYDEKKMLADNICESMRHAFRNWLSPRRKIIKLP